MKDLTQLDDILVLLVGRICEMHKFMVGEETIKQRDIAKAAIKSLMYSIVGEDEKFTKIQAVDHTGNPVSKVYDEAYSLHQVIRNSLRAEQRARIDQL